MGETSPTVFIVDDDDAVRESLSALLESYQFEVKGYASGEAFLTQYSNRSRGCLLLDIHLPVMNGIEILSRLRNDMNCKMPVVMITGRSDKSTKERVLAAGATSHFEKPLDSEQLVATIQALTAAYSCHRGLGADQGCAGQ